MGVSDTEKILQQQMNILLEKAEERKKWSTGAEDIMKLSIGMSYVAIAIIECNRFKLETESHGLGEERNGWKTQKNCSIH